MTNKNKKITVTILFLVFAGLLTFNILHPHKEQKTTSSKTTELAKTDGNKDIDPQVLLESEWEQKYSGNQLENGSQPYSDLYGKNKKSGSSEIIITAPVDEDAIVMVKDDKGNVARHAYIRNNMKYTFHISPGYYQVFFICGSDWCPEKEAPNGQKGYFLRSAISKGNAEYIDAYQQLEYRLQSTINGNFRPQDANSDEAF